MEKNSKIMYIRVSENCNSNCFMCHYAGTKDSYNITQEQYNKLLDFMNNDDYKMIRFTGGEPLLHKELSNFIKQAKNKGYYTSIITNGYLLPYCINNLIELDECIISIDGSKSEIHDKLRNFNGCFDNIILGINNLKKENKNIIIRVNTVVSEYNISDLTNIYELLCKLKVDQWSIIPLKYKNNLWKEESIRYYLEFQEKIKNSKGPILLGYSANFAGNTEKEIKEFFSGNFKAKSNNKCKVINHVRFYIPDLDILVPCNCIAHRLKNIPFEISTDLETGCNQVKDWLKDNSNSCTGCEPLNIYINDHPEIMNSNEILY